MIAIEAIGCVRATRQQAEDDFWGGTQSRIELVDSLPVEALEGIEQFSHAEILYHFDRVPLEKIVSGARHPRNNKAWPAIGIFAQRGKHRPNRLGSSIVRILRREGRALYVAELDAIDGTPVIDIKPVMQEFLPREAVQQPEWSKESMRDYWLPRN
jgi:tRNA-Thr(GGU) m(6)t(6)A37 methyltransferase TsaA